MIETKNYIVSTRIKETWPSDQNEKIFFPSIEALDNFPNSNFPYKNFEIINNNWVNNQELLEKFIYLDQLNEKLLKGFIIFLNNLHNTNHKEKFWRILLGPWLNVYLFMSYDKWLKIQKTINKFSINRAKKLEFDNSLLIPYETQDFINLTQNDLWNQKINQDICLNFLPENNIEKIQFNNIDRLKNELSINRLQGGKDNLIKKILLRLVNYKSNLNYKYVIYNTYIGAIKECMLAIKLKQLPIFRIDKKNYITKKEINYKARNKLKLQFVPNNNFEKYITNSLKNHLPKIFIENFNDLKNFFSNTNLPKKPNNIISSNGLWYDSFFSYYSALHNQQGSKIIYCQHGGSYGIAKYSWQEEHEKKISDKYLTWGWNDINKSGIVKKFYILIKKKKYNWNNKKTKLLILLKHRKIYLQAPDTFAVCETHEEYLKFLNPFLHSLENNIKKNMTLRLTYKNFEDNNFDFYSNLKNKYYFDRSSSLEKACDESRLVVNTCNSTTFLETIASNIPSILILNKLNNPIRESANAKFKILFENELIFYDPLEASKFINKMWHEDIKKWWYGEKIQKAVKEFQSEFARSTKDIVSELKKEILN